MNSDENKVKELKGTTGEDLTDPQRERSIQIIQQEQPNPLQK